MTDTNERAPGTPEDETGAPSTNAQPAPETAAAADPVAALVEENADLKDRLLRALAEMENLRKRTEREVADVRIYGIASFARDVLAVADNMRRALDAISLDQRANADAGITSLIDGVDLTERELLKALEKYNVKRFDPQGQKFDPNLHQAMFEATDPAVPAGHVFQVVQAGYMIGERVLRPALVGISKGKPKVAPRADNNTAKSDGEPAPANDNSGT